MSSEDNLIRFANIVTTLVAIGAFVYVVVSPLDALHPSKETYITPSSWVYFTWPLIFLLLLGTCTYQFSRAGSETILNRIAWRLPMLNVLATMYLYSWAIDEYRYAMFFILFLGSTVTFIYGQIKHVPSRTISDELFVNLPFSLYHGWTTVLILTAAFDSFGVDASVEPLTGWTKAIFIGSLFVLEIVSYAYAYSTAEGDLPACLAISWSLFAIWDHQKSVPSDRRQAPVALAAAIISLLWVLRSIAGIVKTSYKARRAAAADAEEGESQRLLDQSA
ncbi:hypothetical protein CONPUDRAFT_100266 [Coniophora puteana RWD-64-598 SS2]|uniref:Membrane permease n=1 Tax=Coniophora puteana (strain RWD-64-598) TaxID=741705 RepID=A0A5M3MZ35_CONPW|nr:uncharacterized protein CONPUDRAFT_100266 [Coniophora puteana RWD-64-598 SS2]EIW84306.1 hypothetical protein CONPUDRAFT_100266 [Coniophora puteana RWD-64-598 SS2]